ncbi:ABC transporter ATP-binding protein [Leptotrichia sp. oral taxon 879]|uniref:ABC transporter ATP-binding protein n=1 Tax=Leptotrichia sp. oral taxon 879 TaxID=1227267 RepID=UPI0003AE6953|nr:ABC transporter ATP-binding protein [Leptotrichia sp. oral taxon 879]ERK52054.1 ABC transporter, ATP-binding protein [Leptotrichia sp. oral taxon 879 str. F0557]
MKKIELDFGVIQKLKKYIKKYYILIILNLLLATISSLVSSAPIALVKRLFDRGIAGKSEKDILYAAGAMIMLAVIGAVLMYWNTIFSTVISSSIYKDIVTDIYNKIQTLDIEYFSSKKIGDIMTRVMTDPSNINSIILEIFDMISEIIKVIFFLGIAFYIDFDLTLGVMIVTPILVITVRRYAKRLKRSGKQRQEALDGLNSKLQETLSGIRIIRAFATEEYEINNFKKKNNNLKKIAVRSARYNAKANSIMEALNYIIIALLLMFSGYRVLRAKSFTPGDFITIIGAISSMYTPARRAITRFNAINVNLSSITRVSEILEEIPSIVNRPDCVKFKYFADNINFENVDFHYKDNPEKILKNINLNVKKGETVAFVGNSGGGKSTLVNLIPRFFDVSDGSIKIDGIDIRNYDIKSLRKAIGIVPQETFLFAGTILSNIRYGRQDATKEEIIKAAIQANAHEFIENLPDGYDTEIGERGVKLSGGQKQRIAIARAILENPQILILDEATSALDNESEKLVQDALEKLMKGKTTFIIAHRLTTIENSNKIVVIQKGEIKEVGNHNELISKNGIYKALYNKNFDISNKN